MPAPKTKLPKGVRFQRYVLKSTGEVVRYGYYGKGKDAVRLGRADDPEFFSNLAAALKREPKANSMRYLVHRYRQSREFQSLRSRTQSDYLMQLDKVVAEFGELSLRAMSDRSVAQYIYAWRDRLASSPRQADYAVQVLKALLSWGVKRGFLEYNRAAGVERLYSTDRREKSWSDEQITAFLESAPEPLRRALILAVETGQRQGDLLVLPWSSVKGDVIELRQSKTNQPVAIPVSATLRDCLAASPRSDSTTILTRSDGKPWEPRGNGFRAAWRDACKSAGVSGVTFHDLRGTFVTRRLAEGWNTMEVAICTGHSLRDLRMLDSYADRGKVASAMARRVADRLAENEAATKTSK